MIHCPKHLRKLRKYHENVIEIDDHSSSSSGTNGYYLSLTAKSAFSFLHWCPLKKKVDWMVQCDCVEMIKHS